MNTDSDIPLDDSLSIGVDIIEIKRFRDLDATSPFFHRVFTPQELAYCFDYSDPSPHLAAMFAGKEAVIKALNSKQSVSMDCIEIFHNDDGSPYTKICHLPEIKIVISLAHSQEYAIAAALDIPQSQTANAALLHSLLNETTSNLLERT